MSSDHPKTFSLISRGPHLPRLINDMHFAGTYTAEETAEGNFPDGTTFRAVGQNVATGRIAFTYGSTEDNETCDADYHVSPPSLPVRFSRTMQAKEAEHQYVVEILSMTVTHNLKAANVLHAGG
jgi:hypothetical protein